MLNFRHPRRSSVRIVNELPDQIFASLLEGKTLRLEPVPEPSPGEVVSRMPGWDDDELPAAPIWAKEIGIDPNYELPSVSAASGETAPGLHTLLYPGDFDAVLRNVRSTARTAIEESGVNMLFIAFGFLEWEEEGSAGIRRFAPLLLLPVVLERGRFSRVSGTYIYRLSYSGEDIVVNLSLREKLKGAIDVPEIDEQTTPEKYFAAIEREIGFKRGWVVRRWATISLFHFGKLLMYLDLAPDKWPEQGILRHGLIEQLFGNKAVEKGNTPSAGEHDIDEIREIEDFAPLIDDADSSQHSALIDALDGRDLVIEGPPGTGKSQTITNLIAGALFQGKSVLFVSEKLAALEVVRRRLNNCGLGDFCLELHSHKTQKMALLGDIDRRLKKQGRFGRPEQIEARILELRARQFQLKEYMQLVNTKVPPIDLTIHEIFCTSARYRQSCRSLGVDLLEVEVKDLDSITISKMAVEEELVHSLETSMERITSGDHSPGSHPWRWVTNANLAPYQTEHLLADLTRYNEELTNIRACAAKTEAWLPKGATCVESFVAYLEICTQLLGAVSNDAPFDLVGRITREEMESSVNELLGRLQQHTVARKRTLKVFPKQSCVWKQHVPVKGPLDHAADAGLGDYDLDKLQRLQGLLEKARIAYHDLELALNVPLPQLELPSRLKALAATLSIVCDVARTTPFHALGLRDAFSNPAAQIVLDRIAPIVRKQILAQETLGRTTVLKTDIPPLNLRRAASVLGTAGMFGWVRPEWWHARAVARQVLVDYTSLDVTTRQERLADLADYLERDQMLEDDKEAASVLCRAYQGKRTDVEALEQLRQWRTKIQCGLSAIAQLALADTVYQLSPEELEKIRRAGTAGLSETASKMSKLLREISAMAPGLTDCLGNLKSECVESSLSDLRSMVENAVSNMDQATNPKTRKLNEVLAALVELQRTKDLYISIDADEKCADLLAEHWNGPDTSTDLLQAAMDTIRNVRRSRIPGAAKSELLGGGSQIWYAVTQHHKNSLQRLEALNAAQRALSNVAGGVPSGRTFDNLIDACSEAIDASNMLSEWVEYLRLKDDMIAAGLGWLAALLDADTKRLGHARNLYRAAVFERLAQREVEKRKLLRRFNGVRHDQVRNDFCRLDRSVILLQRERIASQVEKRNVPVGETGTRVSDYTELALLNHELGKQKRHLPIRQLMLRAGRALQCLKPCFMMGPMSVAQYLKPGHLEFDLVVMDEASQIRPEEAVGAIARAKQLVVVGDPKQLPPTNFFQRVLGGDDEDFEKDEMTALEESESILEAAMPVFSPIRRLRWHYRSRDERLIKFSNQEFYDNDLVVFPSASPGDPSYGVRLRRVPSGVFLGRRNVNEAINVVDDVVNHMKSHLDESLGVVTMNLEQRGIIEELFDRKSDSDPAIQNYLTKYEEKNEPFFVKNLENVQGDERDVIFISFTYGPREVGGRVPQVFTTITAETGWRRLNVLFTRARKRIVAFSAMRSGDIRVNPTSSRGVKALKGYLEYAATGRLDTWTETNRPPDSDFEVAVADSLRRHGIECVAQLGVSDYFIDLAVKHPGVADGYILAIECDGATYHSAKSVRDRDRLRQMVLEQRGWKVHRIWSTDWYRDPEGQVRVVLKKVKKLIDADFIVGGPTSEETESPLMDMAEVKRQLVELRKEIRLEMPNVPLENGILRRKMLEAFLEKRPTNMGQFRETIPLSLRETIDLGQLKYIDRIFVLLRSMNER